MLKPEQPDYSAGFEFTNNSQWLVRMQKAGAGYSDLYLYRLGPQGFVTATTKPLSDLAWRYFKSLPGASRKVKQPDFHIAADLVRGTEDNYRSLGEDWPDSRYLVISLSGDVSPDRGHGQIRSVRGWRCRYDPPKKTGSTCQRTLPRRTQNRSLPVRIRRSRAAAPARLVHDPEKWKPIFG